MHRALVESKSSALFTVRSYPLKISEINIEPSVDIHVNCVGANRVDHMFTGKIMSCL